MPRIILTEVEVIYRRVRKVYTRVEETDDRLKDARAGKRYSSTVFTDDAKDAAVRLAQTNTLTGWEPFGEPEYRAVTSREVESAPNIDVIV